MTEHPEKEEPGFEHEENELAEAADDGPEDTLEEDADDDDDIEAAQAEAAKEREEDGGYQ